MSTQLFYLLQSLSNDDLARRMASFPAGSREHRLCEQELARRQRAGAAQPNASTSAVRIFVSHSSQDKALAEALVDLLRAALPIEPEEVRCTSVEEHELPADAKHDPTLRGEIQDAVTFVGIITAASIESAYVLFELGARWGSDKHLVPLLGGGADSSFLRGPLAAYNALQCDKAADLHQLINDLGTALRITPHAAASYQRQIERVVTASRERVNNP